MEKSYASGMDAYLTKPISSQALYGLIERLQERD
jgi:CheY-like chemotaxis protein